VRSFINCTRPQILVYRTNRGNEVGRTRGTHGRVEKNVQGFGGKARSKETTRKTEA
jgi:hypothetical protein